MLGLKRKTKCLQYRLNMRNVIMDATNDELIILKEEVIREINRRNKKK